MALANARKGKLKGGFAFAGQNAHRVDRILSVRELLDSLEKEFHTALNRPRKLTGSVIV
jgi:nitronate monooxygenase